MHGAFKGLLGRLISLHTEGGTCNNRYSTKNIKLKQKCELTQWRALTTRA
ncbi:hypothetical protein ALT1644_90012 [Alteromonas macleodii]